MEAGLRFFADGTILCRACRASRKDRDTYSSLSMKSVINNAIKEGFTTFEIKGHPTEGDISFVLTPIRKNEKGNRYSGIHTAY